MITTFRRAATVLAVLVLLALAFLFKGQVRLIPTANPGGDREIAADAAPAAPSAKAALHAVFPGDPSWWSVNAQNQLNQETREVAQQYLSNYYNTCGPAVVAMVASYFRTKALGENERVTAAEVLQDARNQLGFFIPPYNSGLLDFNNLRAITGLYGLSQVYPAGENDLMSFDELVEGVRQGNPAVAGMRYHYREGDLRYVPAGGRGLYNHFVVVFEVSQVEGQDYLWVMNTHPGKNLTSDSDAVPEAFRFDEFKQSWALNDNSDYADHGYAVFYQWEQQ